MKKAANNDLANEISSPRLSDNPSEEGEVKVCYFQRTTSHILFNTIDST